MPRALSGTQVQIAALPEGTIFINYDAIEAWNMGGNVYSYMKIADYAADPCIYLMPYNRPSAIVSRAAEAHNPPPYQIYYLSEDWKFTVVRYGYHGEVLYAL